MHSRFFLNVFASLLIALCLLALLLFSASQLPSVPSAAANPTPALLFPLDAQPTP